MANLKTRLSDYTIKSMHRRSNPSKELFAVVTGKTVITVKRTKEEAQDVIRNLVLDPWHFDRK